MARKKQDGQPRRRKQQAQYDELDKYPVMPPHAFARVVRDKQTLNILYQIIEPPMTKNCLLYTSPSPRDATLSRMPSSA